MKYIIPCILLALTTCLYADDPKSKAIRKYENEVEVLRKQGQAAIKRLEGVFEKEVEKLREKTLKDLQKELDVALEAKDLDEAVALREAIKAFEGAEASGLAAKAEVASKKKIRKRIPKEAVSFGGHKYFYHDQPATYRVALGIAESAGGHLVRIDSLKEFEFIMRMTGGAGMIDGTSEVGDGKWRFANGEELKLGNIRFRAGEPNNFNTSTEFILVLTPQGINDQPYDRYRFIIEWD